ncbi:MAG: hypothetical protein RL497_1538 [Pseudomonadota bacterium]|jgi:hypothetical protein
MKTVWRSDSFQREHYSYGPQGELLAASNQYGAPMMEVAYLEGKPLISFIPTNPNLGIYASLSDKILNPGDNIYIDGTGTGGVSNNYEYRISVKDLATNTSTTIKDWSSVNYTSWPVPNSIGARYSFTVAVRNTGTTASRSTTLLQDPITYSTAFTIQAPLTIASTLSRSQAQPGQSISLSAQVSGGVTGEPYQYRITTRQGAKPSP